MNPSLATLVYALGILGLFYLKSEQIRPYIRRAVDPGSLVFHSRIQGCFRLAR